MPFASDEVVPNPRNKAYGFDRTWSSRGLGLTWTGPVVVLWTEVPLVEVKILCKLHGFGTFLFLILQHQVLSPELSS